MLQSTLVESESGQRASALDNRHSVNSLHTTRRYDHTWADLPLSHTSPHQWCHEVDCNLHGIISRAVIEAAALNWLNNNDQRHHRQRPPEGFLTRFLNIFGEKIEQTQIAVEEAMAELGWLDGATENVTGATEHTNSWKLQVQLMRELQLCD